MSTDVSIVIPIFNVEKYLEQCLESVCSQSLETIEIICVNDGSTDRSLEIINRFAEKDSRVLVINKSNSGYGCSVNKGIEACSGKYIGIVEPDDWIDKKMYQKLFEAAERHGFPDIVKASYWRVLNPDTEQQELSPSFYFDDVEYVDTPFTLDQEARFLFCHPSIWTAIYRKDFLSEADIKMHPIPGAGWADNPFLIETLAQAKDIVYLNENLYFYREFNAGSSSNVKDPSIIYNRWLDMDKIIKDLGITSPRILEGHYCRGCAYIEMLDNDFADDVSAKQAVKQMVSLMDYRLIRDSERIIPGFKNAYQKHVPAIKRLLYRFG